MSDEKKDEERTEVTEYRRRVSPRVDLPKLPPEVEQKIAPVDEASARSYDLQEQAGESAERLAAAIDEGVVSVAVDSGAESLIYVLRPPPKPKTPDE